MGQLAIHLLGPWQVQRDDEPVTGFRHDKVRALLAYLITEAGRPHRRESLAGLLWPDQPERAALHNLRQSLALLRQALGDDDTPQPLIHVTTKTVEFRPQPDVWVDVSEFLRLIQACESHRHRRLETCPACHARLQTAADLYRGEFLAGLSLPDSISIEEWRLVEQERLHGLALTVFGHLAGYHTRRAEYGRAAGYMRRQLALEPWREEAHRDLMRLLAIQGERSAALKQYQACRTALAQELGVDPAPETQALFERIRSGELRDLKAIRPSVPLVPIPPTPLIGREAEVARLTELALDPATRLTTLVGPGGVGKSRLALAVATQVQASLPDGVYVVPLSGLDGASAPRQALVGALATALRLSSRENLEDQLLDYLRARETLLILDSFEHLLAADPAACVDLVVALLEASPKSLLIVTSREPLNLQAEIVVRVHGLALPQSGQATSASETLFVERAQRATGDFALDATTRLEVARICQLVDGLPLGIELAAALTPSQSVMAIADGLARDLRALVAQRRDVPARHHSLRAVFDQSWRLLNLTERRSLAQCAIFQGGFTLDAATAVLELMTDDLRLKTGDPHQSSVLSLQSLLTSLVAKSLLRWSEAAQRYDMHDVVRQFAAEQAATLDEVNYLGRYSVYYLRYVETREAGLVGHAPLAVLTDLRQEWANIRAAWLWAVEQDRVADLDRSLDGLAQLTNMASLHGEGEVLFGSAAMRLAPGDDRLLHGRLLTAQAGCLNGQDRYGEAAQLAQAVVAAAQAREAVGLEAASRAQWAKALVRLGEGPAAQAQFEQAAHLARLAATPRVEAESLRHLGSLVSVEGNYGTAIDCYTQALALDRQQGDRRSEATTLSYLGGALWNLGDYTQSRTYHEQALTIIQTVGHPRDEASILHNLMDTYWPQGDFSEAQAGYERCLQLFQSTGTRLGIGIELADLGTLMLLQGDYVSAANYLAEALPVLEAIHARTAVSHTYMIQGLLCHRLGDLTAAQDWLQQSLDMAYAQADRRMQADAMTILGHVLADLGQWEAARSMYAGAATRRQVMQQPHFANEPLAGLARIALAQGDIEAALASVGQIWPGAVTLAPDGPFDPIQVYLTGYEVWQAAGDPRAQPLLDLAAQVLHSRAAKLPSEARRRVFLDNIPSHRALLALRDRTPTFS